jgi:aspartate 1-decarboxylase
MLKAKLHLATVTRSEPDYEGSLSIDQDLMEAVKIEPYEKILVANLENGNRFETYAIPGARGSGVIGLNGPATHQGTVGDRLVVLSFCLVEAADIPRHKPRILVLGSGNRPRGGVKEP